MKMQLRRTHAGTAIICALTVIVIVSLIGAGVLINSTTRYNVMARQLKAWKEALYAAESGGDIGFAEVRKLVSNSSPWSADGWTPTASPSPTPGWIKTTPAFGEANSLSATVTVDQLTDAATGYNYYRVRAKGTARLLGLRRGGMDDVLLAGGTYFNDTSVKANRALARGVGDSLLRKIDFKYDHFAATYGDGDFGPVPAPTPLQYPQVSRRIELVVVPKMMFFDGAMRVTASFNGPGSAGVIDSYSSQNGGSGKNDSNGSAYKFVANNPSDPNYPDSRNGNVSVATKNFSEGGPIYGDVTTNGGNVTHSGTQISGTIDNNVPFTIPPLVKPDTSSYTSASGSTLTVPTGTTQASPAKYVFSSSLSDGFTISGQNVASGNPNAGKPAETYVTIVVNGDVGNVTIAQGVNAAIYFTGNLSIKAKNTNNNNADGAPGVYNADGTASTNYSKAGHLQFYGISPTDGSTQTINIAPPGGVYAVFYAPNGDISLNGNPDIYGAVVAHNFSGNGNTGFHYDKRLAGIAPGQPIDFQVASFVEDVR
jgi:hypothetical protein